MKTDPDLNPARQPGSTTALTWADETDTEKEKEKEKEIEKEKEKEEGWVQIVKKPMSKPNSQTKAIAKPPTPIRIVRPTIANSAETGRGQLPRWFMEERKERRPTVLGDYVPQSSPHKSSSIFERKTGPFTKAFWGVNKFKR